MNIQIPPLSLYVHLPWCVRKCPYCDFNSHTAGDKPPRRRYLNAVISDIQREARRAGDRELISVFLGGGTPSLFAPSEIDEILLAVTDNFRTSRDIEITMEANPGTVEHGDPRGYRAAGVNRLSIGAQSFSTRSLALLGRIHTVDDIGRTVDESRLAGFDNINLDMMHALPGQDVDNALSDLTAAIALEPEHLSWYQLTLEPNTVFYSQPPQGLPDNDLCYEIQLAGQALLAENGFMQYEVSAYARNGHRCRHNLNYWSFGDYLAVGAGAHGKLSDLSGIRRYTKPRNPLSYMQFVEAGETAALEPPLEPATALFELMLNGLRLTEGVSDTLAVKRAGVRAEYLAERLTNAIEKRLIEYEKTGERQKPGRIRATALGMRFLNDLQVEFLP